jgi:hypothetical protein
MESWAWGASLSHNWIRKSVLYQGSNELIFKGLYGVLCCIDRVVMWFGKLEADLLRSEVIFDDFWCLFVHQV